MYILIEIAYILMMPDGVEEAPCHVIHIHY